METDPLEQASCQWLAVAALPVRVICSETGPDMRQENKDSAIWLSPVNCL